MGTESQTFLFSLLQALAVLWVPTSIAFSTCNGLVRKPGRFGIAAFGDRLVRCRRFEYLWMLAAGAWTASAWANAPASIGGGRMALGVSVAGVWAATVALRMWADRILVPELRAKSGDLCLDDLVAVDSDNKLVVDVDAPAGGGAVASAAVGRAAAAALVAAIGLLYVACGLSFGAGASLSQWVFLWVLAGLYMSAGILIVDLHFDYWPGQASLANLKRAASYYVLIFEHWIHQPVLVGLMTAMLVAPVAYWQGMVPAGAAAFGGWTLCCLVFAAFFNGALNGQGIVGGRCPLPVAKNVYSVEYPFWTHFFAFIHSVMLGCLVYGIGAMNAAVAG